MLFGIPSGEAYLLAEGGVSRGGACEQNNSEEGKGKQCECRP